jgi:transposase
MPPNRHKQKLIIDEETIKMLTDLASSMTESHDRVERARILLDYHDDIPVSRIAFKFNINKSIVYNCITRALQEGVEAALDYFNRMGRPAVITEEAKRWLINLARSDPKDLGYSCEYWSQNLLNEHIRNHCLEGGHECLSKLANGTITKIFFRNKIVYKKK